jgi:hypothetical protein
MIKMERDALRKIWQTRAEIIENGIQRLLSTGRLFPISDYKAVMNIADKLLRLPADLQKVNLGPTILNNDGTPIELCLTLQENEWKLRIIVDPAIGNQSPAIRLHEAWMSLQDALVIGEAQGLGEICQETLDLLLPNAEEIDERYGYGAIWVAVGVNSPGAGFYVNAEPIIDDERWEMARRWLEMVLPDSAEACSCLAKMKSIARIKGYSIEGKNACQARAKIYFYLKEAVPLKNWGIAFFTDPSFEAYLRIVTAKHQVANTGFVVGIGFDIATGKMIDGKIDLCGHCLNYRSEEWLIVLKQLINEFHLHPLPTERILQTKESEMAFIGLGLDLQKRTRLNIYLKPADMMDYIEYGHLNTAIDKGINYLIGRQNEQGYWTDYCLPVGKSDQWVTAFVGLALAELAEIDSFKKAREGAEKAAGWLHNFRTYNVGWGYNGITGPDVDSTAYALQLLTRLGYPVRPADRDFLLKHWQSTGGFSTYLEDNAWGVAHPCVTPLAFLSLSDSEQERLKISFINYVNRARMTNGLWPSYWWSAPYYSTYMNLKVLKKLKYNEISLSIVKAEVPEPENDFNLACLIGIYYLSGSDAKKTLIKKLLFNQDEDGFWKASENLRVVDPKCYTPWVHPVGQCYQDLEHTITTAMVIQVIALFLKTRV